MPRLVGYARVSTSDQNPDLQIDALRTAGADPIFVDRGESGSKRRRPELDRCLAALEAGDTLFVWRLDRLSRSLGHLVLLVDELRGRGVKFRSLTETIDTSTAAGELLLGLFGALAQYERAMIKERVNAGIEAARRRGQQLGRRRSLTTAQIEMAASLRDEGRSLSEIGEILAVSPPTVLRALRRREQRVSS
jgi:DNA invertase Pin-like site-specific DNA recombinase